MSFPFLAHLGLRNDADERDIKRAYARLLKQIDQATDAAAFQALREAYEAALDWHRQGGEAAPTPTPSHAPSPPPAAPTPQPPPVHSLHDVHEVFQAFMVRLTRHGDKAAVRQALLSSLEDPRVQSLDARDTFESLVAHTLGKGWKPGHDILMAVAIEFFKWGSDPRHLSRFGQAGSEIDQAIADAAMFDSQPAALRERLMEVVRLLRNAPRGDDAAKAELHRTDLELLLVHFGSWLRLNAPAERVQQWRQWARNPPERSALLADVEVQATAPPPRPAPAAMPKPMAPPQTPPPASKHGSRKTAALWFVLGLSVGMASMFAALEGPHMFNGQRTASPANDPLDAVKAAYQPRFDPPGFGPPQRPPPYHPPPPPMADTARPGNR